MEDRKRNPLNIPEWIGAASFLAAVPYALFVIVLAIRFSGPAMPPTGDEPHYLIVAHSLAVDGDLSLANNYLGRHYRLFYKGELAKRTSPSADRTRELPAQGLGLSFLLAPVYKLVLILFPPALLTTLRLVMCSITTIVLYNLLRVAAELMVSPRAAFFVICGAAVASPILTYSSLFYPEIPACLMITIALRNLVQMEEHRWSAFFWLAFSPGALVWLHPKYLALALCIVITGTIFFYRTFRVYNNKLFPFFYGFVAALGILSFFLFLHSEYGGWSPNRIYAGWEKAPQGLFELIRQEGIGRIGTMLRMVLGFWIDQRFGLIVYAPLYVLFFSAFIYIFRKNDGTRFILFWFLIHFLILCWGAPLGGFAPPSRHMIVLLPLILVTIAYAFSEYSGARALGALILFALAWILAALMYFDFRSLFTNVTWRNPDGVSPFWERYGLDPISPLLTASQLNWGLIIAWCFALAALSWFFYPRARPTSPDHS